MKFFHYFLSTISRYSTILTSTSARVNCSKIEKINLQSQPFPKISQNLYCSNEFGPLITDWKPLCIDDRANDLYRVSWQGTVPFN